MKTITCLLLVVPLGACASTAPPTPPAPASESPAPAPPTPAELRQEVWDTELAFAATMADRDHAAFVSFLAPDTVFVTAARTLRGRDEVAAGWKPFFEGPDAPFSWEPDEVELLEGGDRARSTGPVTAADGSYAGRFVSIWRRDADRWRIESDRGEP